MDGGYTPVKVGTEGQVIVSVFHDQAVDMLPRLGKFYYKGKGDRHTS